MLLKNRIALVTGSTHNIGLAIARAFSREGAKVIVHSRHEEDARKIAQEINGDFFAADVAQPDQIGAMFEHIKKKHSRVDVLVNSVAHSSKGGILDVTLEEWQRIMSINLTGYFLCLQHAGKMMKEQGGGSIINVASASGIKASPGASAYCSSKAAVIHFTRTVALECQQAEDNIRLNVVAPGGVRTPMWKTMPGWQELARESEEAAWKKLDPKSQFHTPEEIASTLLYLASDAARHVTAAVLTVDRGYTA